MGWGYVVFSSHPIDILSSGSQQIRGSPDVSVSEPNARISCFTFGSLMAPQGYEGFVDIDTRVDNDGRFEG